MDLIDLFIDDVCDGKTNETPITYRRKLNQLANYLGGDAENWGQAEINGFRRWMLTREEKRRGGSQVKERLSPWTIRTVFATVRHFLRWASEHGEIPAGIELRQISEPTVDPKAIDQETVDRLIRAAQTIPYEWERARDLALLYVLRDCGCRVGPVAKLDLSNLDLTNGKATAPDKRNEICRMRFCDQTIAALREWLRWRDTLKPRDYLVFTGERGKGLSRQGIARVLDRLAKRAGTTARHNPHSFRHAWARDTLQAGGDLSRASQGLGHKSVVVTVKYYSRWADDELMEFHRRFSPGKKLPEIEKN